MINQHINCGSPLNKNIFSPTNFINLFSMLLVLCATFFEKQLYATKILSNPPPPKKNPNQHEFRVNWEIRGKPSGKIIILFIYMIREFIAFINVCTQVNASLFFFLFLFYQYISYQFFFSSKVWWDDNRCTLIIICIHHYFFMNCVKLLLRINHLSTCLQSNLYLSILFILQLQNGHFFCRKN